MRPEIVQQARTACRELRLVGKPRKRTRRPTVEELKRLREYFKSRDRRATIPMEAIVSFAIASARRESEICRLEWHDNDKTTRTGMVRDAKHPTAKDGNHRRFKYTPEAWALVTAQPQTSEYIFPYDPKSIGTAFTRACKLLGIHDLRFHDLRHTRSLRNSRHRGAAISTTATRASHAASPASPPGRSPKHFARRPAASPFPARCHRFLRRRGSASCRST